VPSGDDGACTSHIDSVHRHLAERDLMEDEDLSVLLQLASNHNPNTPRSSSIVFRSSPLLRQTSNRNEGDDNNNTATDTDDGSERKKGSLLLSKLESAASAGAAHDRQSSATANSEGEMQQRQHSNTDFDPPLLMFIP
jgi:hypothetical protein